MRRRKPVGYTLIELIAASASATVLLVGLSSALFVSSQALNADDGVLIARTESNGRLRRLLDDVSQALEFKTRTATKLEFTVPDITGDDQVDTLVYEWSGVAGDPLTVERNGGGPLPFIKNVQSLSFEHLDRTVTATDVTVAPDPPWPILESLSAWNDPNQDLTALDLPAPAGVQAGELLIACFAIENNVTTSLTGPVGWSPIEISHENDMITLGVWWKLATDAEPATYTWTWGQAAQPVGLIMRISNQYAGNPLTSFVGNGGTSETPECSETDTTRDNSMVLRIGAFHADKLTGSGQTGVAGHTDVYMESGDRHCTLGAAYEIQTVAGATGAAEFELTMPEEYRTLTLVVAPNQEE